MGYVACANCGNLNKEGDPTCYSCGLELVAAAPPPPPPIESVEESGWGSNADIRVQPLRPGGGSEPNKGRFKDLASRYEARKVPKTQATILHGLRSGLPAGLLAGFFMAIYRKYQVDDLTRLLVRGHPHMAKHGSEIMVYSVGFDVFLGLIIGFVLGLTNLLCFTPEATRTGAVLGAVAGAILVFMVGGNVGYVGVAVGALNGALIAFLASSIEKLIRGG